MEGAGQARGSSQSLSDTSRYDSVAASEAKLLTSELLCDVADEGVQLHGGAGYMDEYPISRVYTDARITRIFAGTSEIMKLIIARSIFS